MKPLITIHIGKSWKSTFLFVTIGGIAIGISSWFIYKRFFLSRKEDVDSAITEQVNTNVNTFPRTCKRLRGQTPASVCSRSSNSRPLSSLFKRTTAFPVALNHELDFDEGSSLNLDCGKLGLRTLAEVVDHLEALMSKIRYYEENDKLVTSSDSENLINDLKVLLEQAYQLREQYRRRIILEDQENVADISETGRNSDDETCSYFSALEQIDLTELEYEISQNVCHPLYCNALRLLDGAEIPFRSLRTQLVGCERDFEYLAKLHCLRQAFDFIFDQPEPTIWICAVGKLSGFRLLHGLGYPINDFKEAYERLLTFVNDQKHNPNNTMAEELTTKGVKVINFYDVVIDLMLLDSLELLSDPPASVLSVTRHRWLSDNFKRVALDSTIWTILLAKRKLLKYADGFYAHYYTLVGTVTPALAWGFLGPDEGALRMCNRFREVIVAFLREAFMCYHKPRATEGFRRQGTPTNLDLEDILPASSENSHAENKQPVSDFESDKQEHIYLNSSDDVDGADNGDDNSTIIYQAPVGPDSCNHISDLSRDRDKTGLRYTTVPELAEDLYCLFIDCMAQLARMFREEARLAMNPQPDDWNINPEPPILRVF